MPTIQIQDRAPLTRVRKLADGRICATARFARSGVYQYSGSEVGRPDLGTVNVYRPEAEVFDEAAMASFAHKAITLNHPSQHVDAANWRDTARGYTEGKVARDGDHVEIPLMLADAEAVSAYETGRATELSAGYVCDLSWETGTAPDGTAYQAVQRRIRGNHIALVPQGRAGSTCRIGDSNMAQVDYERGIVEAQMGDGACKGWDAGKIHGAYEAIRVTQGATGAPAGNDWARAVRDAARGRPSASPINPASYDPTKRGVPQLATTKAVRDAARLAQYR